MAQLEDLGQPEHGHRPGPPPAPPTLRTRIGEHAAAGQREAARGARRLEQAIVRVDPRSVLNLSLAFFRRMLILGLGLGALLWVAALVTGAASSIDTFIQDLSGYPSLTVLGFQGLLVALVLGLTFVVGGALVAVLAVVLFNLASDIGGGIKMTVMETDLDEGLVGRDGLAGAEGEHSGPRPVAHASRGPGAARRRPVLGANVTNLNPQADAGPAGSPEDTVGDGSDQRPTDGDRRTPPVPRGALVVGVEPDSPAHSAGLEAGDVIVSVDSTTVDSPASLSSALDGHDTDTAAYMSWVDHEGRYHTAAVHLGARSG